MHESNVMHHYRFELSSRDYDILASNYMIEQVASALDITDQSKVSPMILHAVPGFTLDIIVPQSKVQRLEERIKAIEKHFREQGWLKLSPIESGAVQAQK